MASDTRRAARAAKTTETASRALPAATMDVRETARYMGVSEQTVRAEIKANRLPIIRIRSRIRVVRALLEQMIVEEAKRQWKP